MKKTLLSIVIIALAVVFIIINLWKLTTLNNNEVMKDIYENEDVVFEENIPVSYNIPESTVTGVQKGNAAPDFELTTLDGTPVKLSNYKGKKVILNFWATWCPPCKDEMPHMQNFYEKNKENGIEIVAVNLTDVDNGQKAIENFVKNNGLTFQIPLDRDGKIGEIYQTISIPTSYILDSKGIITNKIIGPMDEEMMYILTQDIQ
ncbi:redoxin domain-containing protein [Schinkia azotoformans]|uniref:redoxin domain-containing protein n=1 Tax=Schinkia azotoformans TaxID=1454 RepID=UPI002DB94B11|nr:redoxin domain-containing protein [Schinkia azotoformans]MEC1743334.1 redoxin domain-containing protein [Schinkia azotoformans]MEC1769496.1 redoxin domain-containing protein [Schinkia azotoformans]MEC1788661.1 redoxin domain-containing protein [Schinkia azotoformans]MED4377332.1 redoxin domain-containing protein [Schinkia azotoformans]MED4420169.1 redoxin domain-containing protein [Schinkia azotoformans]